MALQRTASAGDVQAPSDEPSFQVITLVPDRPRLRMVVEQLRLWRRRVACEPTVLQRNSRRRLTITRPPADQASMNSDKDSLPSKTHFPCVQSLYRCLLACLPRVTHSNTRQRTNQNPKDLHQASKVSQSQSSFLRLPGELRNLIYQYIVVNDTFHVAVNERARRLGYVKCT
jgi:hypothetical protein